MTRIKEFFQRPFGYFTALFLIGAVSYLINTSALGFYWDDWQGVFLYKTGSLQSVLEYFKYDRPMSAWTYWITFPWVPMTPLAWQILTVLIRVTGVWLLTKSFMLLWPDHTEPLRWYGVLLMVFPTFNLQNISVAFSQHFFTMLLFSLSIYTMIVAIQVKTSWSYIWGFISLLSGAGHLLTMEYFAGLEVVRPLIIWIAIERKNGARPWAKKLSDAALISLPYLALLGGYLYWRVFLYTQMITVPSFEDPNAPVLLYELRKAPLTTIITLANLALQDTVYLITQSWLIPLETSLLRLDAKYNLLSWFSGILVAGLFAFLSYSSSRRQDTKSVNRFTWQGIIVGILLIILGGLPVWLTDRSILVGKWSARFSLAPMLGAALFLVVLVYWFIGNKKKQAVFLIVVSGLAIAYQMQITHKYALDWEKQRDYFWQMHWRIPAIEPNTAFFSANVPSNYSSHHAAGFALNIMYGGDELSEELVTWYFRPADAGASYADMVAEKPIDFKLRSISYTGSTSNVIGIQNHMSAPACLLVLDQVYAENPLMEPADRDIMSLSNLERINLEAQPEKMDTLIFGNEPDHEWCYYFEKADLARQQQDWTGVYQMMDQAYSKDLNPKNSLEYTPLLEAQFNQGDWNGMIDTSRKMVDLAPNKATYLCSLWSYLEESSGSQPPTEVLNEMNLLVDCSQPSIEH